MSIIERIIRFVRCLITKHQWEREDIFDEYNFRFFCVKCGKREDHW